MATRKYRLRTRSMGHNSVACGNGTSHQENNIRAVWRPDLVADLSSMNVAPPSEGIDQNDRDTDKAKRGSAPHERAAE